MSQTLIAIRRALPADAETVARMVVALTDEIIARTHMSHFDVNLPETTARCREFIESGKYAVYIAEAAGNNAVGFAALGESHALYTEGAFGIVQEFYVAPEHRSSGIGQKLLQAAESHAQREGWKRLELCTPPLPEFQRALEFYERNGFEVTGGRKMKRVFNWGGGAPKVEAQ